MRNILIIGASGEIGSQIALQLGKKGYSLILHYHQNYHSFEQLKKDLPENQLLDFIQADLTNEQGINRLIGNIAYPIDAVVFSSGIAYYGLLQETPEQVMNDMLSIHVKAPLAIVKNILPDMIRRKSGKIIMITSIWGEIGASYEVVYSTVKGAQNSFVKALAKEVGPSGITVNAISPGFIDTKMNPLSHEEKAQLLEDIPLNRPGTPEDVANAVTFLLSQQGAYIHGEILRISGGWD